MAAPRIIYKGENGVERYVGDFRTEDNNEMMTGFVAIDDSPEGADPDDKKMKLIPRERTYAIEGIAYEDDRDKPTLSGEHR